MKSGHNRSDLVDLLKQIFVIRQQLVVLTLESSREFFDLITGISVDFRDQSLLSIIKLMCKRLLNSHSHLFAHVRLKVNHRISQCPAEFHRSVQDSHGIKCVVCCFDNFFADIFGGFEIHITDLRMQIDAALDLLFDESQLRRPGEITQCCVEASFFRLSGQKWHGIGVAEIGQHLSNRHFSCSIVGDSQLQRPASVGIQSHHTGSSQQLGIFCDIRHHGLEWHGFLIDGDQAGQGQFFQQKVGCRIPHEKLKITPCTSGRLYLLFKITLIVAHELHPGQNLLQLSIHRFPQQSLRDSPRIGFKKCNRVLYFFLISFAGVIQRLKVGPHFRDDVFEFISKTLNLNDDRFCFLADLQILFNLLQRVALFGIFELQNKPIDSWFHRFCPRRHFHKSLVPLFVGFSSQAVSLEGLRIELRLNTFSKIGQPFSAKFRQLFGHPRRLLADWFRRLFELPVICSLCIKTKTIQPTFFNDKPSS